MANEFVIKNGYHSKGDSEITGSLNVTGGITGSLYGTGSYSLNSISSSYSATGSSADAFLIRNGLSINAGTTTVPPIQLVSGDLLNIVSPGAIEFKDDDYYVGNSTPQPSSYVSHYPPAQNSTYVKAINGPSDTVFEPYYGTDPTKSLTGTWAYAAFGMHYSYASRLLIDLGSTYAISRLYYENGHTNGLSTGYGMKYFTLYGSNDINAFNITTWNDTTGWIAIPDPSQTYFDQHVAADVADPKYITYSNTTPYRYYSIMFHTDGWGTVSGIMRRIELQSSDVTYKRNPLVQSDVNNLTETKIPLATTNGRLVDSGITQSGSLLIVSGNLSISASGSLYGTSSYSLTSSYVSGLDSYVRKDLTDSDTQDINGSLKLTGDIIAENYIISSSVLYVTTSYSSGSTRWGDSLDDIHQVTGSLKIVGNVTSSGDLLFPTTDTGVKWPGSKIIEQAGSRLYIAPAGNDLDILGGGGSSFISQFTANSINLFTGNTQRTTLDANGRFNMWYGADVTGSFNTSGSINQKDGAVWFNGDVGTTPTSGAGTRFMYIPEKGASLRVGKVTGTQWDASSIGSSSFSVGEDNTVAAPYGASVGYANTINYNAWAGFTAGRGNTITGVQQWQPYIALGVYNGLTDGQGWGVISIGHSNTSNTGYVFGVVNNVTGVSMPAYAIGGYNKVNGNTSIALGYYCNVTGHHAIGANYYVSASSYIESAFGRYNIGGFTNNSWVSTEPLFQVGNGTSATDTNDAFRLNKNASGWFRYSSSLAPILSWTSQSFVGVNTESPSMSLDVSGSGRFTNNLTVTGSLIINNSTTYVSSSTPTFVATTGSLYIDTPTQKISTKISSGSEWEGINYYKTCYLNYAATSGTLDGYSGCHLIAPGTWSVSQYNTIYFVDDSAGPIQVQIPDSDANNQGKTILVVKPRLVTSNNQIEVITPGGQTIAQNTKYYLRSSDDRGHFVAVPFVSNGAAGYKWRLIQSRQNTRQIVTVGNHGSNFSNVRDAVNFFNSYSFDDTELRIEPGTYIENPITINNTTHSIILRGNASTNVDLIPSSSCYSQSFITIKSACDLNRFKINGNDLSNYGSLNTEHLVNIQDNNYHEFKDIFLYGGYNGINITSSYNPEIYMLDAEIAEATGSGIRVENGEIEIRTSFFEDNNIAINLVTGSVYFSTIGSEFYVPAGKVGIMYQSASTTVDTFSVLSNEFSGQGTYLSGSNYAQEHDANIKISGNTNLANNNPFSYLSFWNNATSTATNPAGTFIKAVGTNNISTPSQKFSVTNNRHTYLAEVTKSMLVTVTGNLQASANNQSVAVSIVKNATSASFMYAPTEVRCVTLNQPFSFAIQGIVEMKKNDYVEVWYTNQSSAANTVLIQDMQFIVREI